MTHDPNEVSVERDVSAQEAAALLQRLADGLRSGTITVASGASSVSLPVFEPIELSVEARVKRRRHKLDLALRWETPDPAPLRITTGPPQE